MQRVAQDLLFTTVVSDTTDANDFILEFIGLEEGSDQSLVKVTKNFDELLQFLDELEDL